MKVELEYCFDNVGDIAIRQNGLVFGFKDKSWEEFAWDSDPRIFSRAKDYFCAYSEINLRELGIDDNTIWRIGVLEE
jgi:hypothetical protein